MKYSILYFVTFSSFAQTPDLGNVGSEMGSTAATLNQLPSTKPVVKTIKEEREEDRILLRRKKQEEDEETRRDSLGNQKGQGYL